MGATISERAAVLELASLLVERQPRATEDCGFTQRYVTAATRAASVHGAPPAVLIASFRGLATLLQAFALSHAHRARVSAFAMRQYAASDVIKSLLALELVVACMYTGDDTEHDANSGGSALPPPSSPSSSMSGATIGSVGGGVDDDDATSHMSNIERIKLLISELKSSGAGRVTSLALPRLLRAFFAPEPMLLFVLGHLARHAVVRDVTARVLHDACATMRGDERRALLHWVGVCMPNFVQASPPSLAAWYDDSSISLKNCNVKRQARERESVLIYCCDRSGSLLA